ncbi:MAG: hypothetical protein QOE07_1929 [Acidimicrobiaceae bacterium]|nr:hypothetical protein [Acidimicrobiaceae bacterium]
MGAILVGLVAGGAFVVLSPTTYVSKARVVLPPSPVDAQGHDIRDVKTELQIVRGAAVLGPTTTAVQPSIELAALQRAISVQAVSSQIIEIAGRSGSSARAAQLANAVASSYVAYADDTATAEANSTAAAYGQEVSQLNDQVRQLDQQIATNTAALTGLTPAEAQRREAVIDTLRAQQSVLAQQLNIDQSRIADAQLQAQLSRQGTHLLQPALAPGRPASPKPLVDIALGALAGMLIGGILALAIENGDRRVRTRDGIGDALDAPVLASLAIKPIDRPDRCQAFLEHWEPSVIEAYALRQAFDHAGLVGATGERPRSQNLVLVGLAGDIGAPALALEVAVFSAATGTQTAMVFASHDASSAALRAACQAAAPGGLGPRGGLVIHGATGNVDPDLLDGAELVVTFVAADAGPIHVPQWDRPTRVAVAVSAGSVTAERLHEVAAACAGAGTAVVGAFLANPDPSDRSAGQRVGVGPGPGPVPVPVPVDGPFGGSSEVRTGRITERQTESVAGAERAGAERAGAERGNGDSGAAAGRSRANGTLAANGTAPAARRVTTVKAPATAKTGTKTPGAPKSNGPMGESEPAGSNSGGTAAESGAEG